MEFVWEKALIMIILSQDTEGNRRDKAFQMEGNDRNDDKELKVFKLCFGS